MYKEETSRILDVRSSQCKASLTGNGTISVTSSILNLTGHKDEALCRRLAEKLCRETGRVVVCTGGFHIDNMKPEQIDEVVKASGRAWRMRLCQGLLGRIQPL